MVDDCIFCKIIAGDIPSSKVYEDEEVLAFLDISQVTPGHTLVVPKKHARNLLEMDETATAQLFARVSKVAKKVEAATQAKGNECHQQHGRSFWTNRFSHTCPHYPSLFRSR